MPSEIERDLEGLLVRRPAGVEPAGIDPARRDALGAELAAQLAARSDARQPRRRWPKIALGFGLGLAVAAGACVVPVDYATGVGHRLAIVVDHEVEVDPRAVAEYITENYAPEQLRMSVSEERSRVVDEQGAVHETHDMRIAIDAIGEDIDTSRMWDDLVEAFPELGEGRLEDEAVTATVHGTLGGRLSDAWLDVVIDRDGVDAAKAEILRQLDLAGVEGDANVEIVDDQDADGRTRREVRVWVEKRE